MTGVRSGPLLNRQYFNQQSSQCHCHLHPQQTLTALKVLKYSLSDFIL